MDSVYAMTIEICVLGSGSSGNATYLGTERTKILVDCGLPAREIVNRLDRIGVKIDELSGILISHAHSDHFRSAGTIYARFGIVVYTDPRTDDAIRRRGDNNSFWRIARTKKIPRKIGDFTVSACQVPHGGHDENTGYPVGFIFEHHGTRVAHFTDLGEVKPVLCSQIRGANCYVIEANYHDPLVKSKLQNSQFIDDWYYLEWVASPQGHLSNTQCAEALANAVDERTTDIFIAHLSENHHDPTKDNNDFHTALKVISQKLKIADKSHPKIHRTYRRGKTESRPSQIISL